MTINIRDNTAVTIADAASLDFDQAIIASSVKGGTATVGTRVMVSIRVGGAMDLQIAYATNGPDAVLVFRDRGTVDKLVSFVMFQAIYSGIGTNMRFTITNRSGADATVEFFSTLL